jgi:hypothetical protein
VQYLCNDEWACGLGLILKTPFRRVDHITCLRSIRVLIEPLFAVVSIEKFVVVLTIVVVVKTYGLRNEH